MADPTPASPQKLADLIETISSFKKDFNSENLIEEVKKRIKVFFICVYGILSFLIILLLLESENRKNFLDSISHQEGINWLWIFLIIVFSLILIFVTYELNRKINNFKKSNESLANDPKIVESSIISRINLLEGNINLNYTHSQVFFESIIKKYVRSNTDVVDTSGEKPYEKFVKEFKEVNKDITPKNLTIIADDIQKSTNGCFYCVISYDGFFNDKTQTEESIRYFASFYQGTDKNFVQRIFTIPGTGTKHTTYKIGHSTEEEKKKSCILLKYLIVNKITSIETYLLVYDSNNLDSIHDKFFTLADYVIALPSSSVSSKANKLFFAYPEKTTGDDQVVVTSDSYLIQLMKKDFDYRIDKVGKKNLALNVIELRKESYDDILEMLGFDLTNQVHVDTINTQIDELKTVLLAMSKQHSYFEEKSVEKLLAHYKKTVTIKAKEKKK